DARYSTGQKKLRTNTVAYAGSSPRSSLSSGDDSSGFNSSSSHSALELTTAALARRQMQLRYCGAPAGRGHCSLRATSPARQSRDQTWYVLSVNTMFSTSETVTV